jgi:heme exporter protein D
MDGMMGGMWVWMIVGILLIILLVVVIVKLLQKRRAFASLRRVGG